MSAYRTEPSDSLDPRLDWCERCAEMRPFDHPWHGWKKVRIGLFCVLGLLLLMSPILSADYIVMIPTSLAIAAGIGPANHMAGRISTCTYCGLGQSLKELAELRTRRLARKQT